MPRVHVKQEDRLLFDLILLHQTIILYALSKIISYLMPVVLNKDTSAEVIVESLKEKRSHK